MALACLVAVGACFPAGGSNCDPTSPVRVTHVSIPTLQAARPSFGAIVIDQATHLLYLADRSDAGVDVFDVTTSSPAYVRTVPTGAGPNGLALAPDLGKLYAGLSNGKLDVIALGPQPSLLKEIDLKAPTDLVEYDPAEKKVFAAQGDSLAVVDAAQDALLTTIKLQKGLRQPRYNPADKMVYVAGSTQNVLYRIDPREHKLAATLRIGTDCNPAGVAINPRANQGLLGCASTQTVAFDFKAGKRTSLFDQATGGELAIYDDKADRFFVAQPGARGGGQVAIFTSSPIQWAGAVSITGIGGGVAFDQANRLVYVSDQRPGKGGIFSFKPPGC